LKPNPKIQSGQVFENEKIEIQKLYYFDFQSVILVD